MTERTVAVIIPALNEEHSLPYILDALVAQRFDLPTNLNILVVNNDSIDQSLSVCKRYPVKVISVSPRNRSLARNKGADVFCNLESASVLVFLDCDCRFNDKFIDNLTRPVFANINFASQALLMPRGSMQPLKHLGRKFLDTKACAIRATDFMLLNGFDESLPRCEDIDFGWRLTESNINFEVVAQAITECGDLKSVSSAFWRGVETASGLVSVHRKHKMSIPHVLMGMCQVSLREIKRASCERSISQKLLRLLDGAVTFVGYWLFRVLRPL